MRRGRRILLGLGTVLLLLFVAAGGALTWLVTTRAGFDWALAQARPYLPENVSCAGAEGRMIGPIEVRDLQVTGEAADVGVERVRLRWRPRALLSGQLRIERLAVTGVDVAQKPQPDDTRTEGPPSLPGLP